MRNVSLGKNSQHFATPPLASRANILRRASRGLRMSAGEATPPLVSVRMVAARNVGCFLPGWRKRNIKIFRFHKLVYSTSRFLHLSLKNAQYPIGGKSLHIRHFMRHFIHLFWLSGVRAKGLNYQEVVIGFMLSFRFIVEEKDHVI